jgi:alkylhydroperoxidase/carboxymuconolactone decarboxylase family protein YurZ
VQKLGLPRLSHAICSRIVFVHPTGPLDARSARFVKLGVAIGAQAEGAVRSHARRALAENMTPDEVRHVGLLALTTIGFPHTVAGLGWIDEVIASRG